MSTPLTRIPKLSHLTKDSIGKTVQLHGWIYSVRTQGAGTLCFMDVGDGTTVSPLRCLAQKDAEGAEPVTDPYHGLDSPALVPLEGDVKEYKRLSFEQLGEPSQLCLGCSVMMIGCVTDPPEGTTQTLEVKVQQVYVMGGVADPTLYPLQKSILKKPLALRALHHARFRAPLIQQWMQIRSQTLFSVHEFFHQEGVPLCDPNILTANDCEGAGEVFNVAPQMFTSFPAVDGGGVAAGGKKKKKKNKGGEEGAAPAETPPPLEPEQPATPAPAPPKPTEVGLTVSSQLPLEAIAMGTGSVYTCQKSFRAEKSDTNKHLAEFLHVEYEQYFLTLDDLMDQAERFVKHVMTKVVMERCVDQYRFLGQKHTAPVECHGHAAFLQGILEENKPFVRIKHADAVNLMLEDLKDKTIQSPNDKGKLVRLKFKVLPKHGEDLGSEHEKYLIHKFGGNNFVFVTHWPSAIKSFYMKQVGDGTCESFDLLAPLVGELFGGSMREWRHDVLEDMMKNHKGGMDMTPLQWYVDLRKDGTAPHGGWGMGFDRLVMLLTNASSVRDIVPYPVYYGHCPY